VSEATYVGLFFLPQELETLRTIGWKIGKDVKVSRFARINTGDVEIGDYSQVDADVVLTGRIRIGRYCHIAMRVLLFGEHGISIGDAVGISAGSILLTGTDDFRGNYLVGPSIPLEHRLVKTAAITIGATCAVGAQSTLLPGAHLENNAALGAHSMLMRTVPTGQIYGGVPAKFISNRESRAYIERLPLLPE